MCFGNAKAGMMMSRDLAIQIPYFHVYYVYIISCASWYHHVVVKNIQDGPAAALAVRDPK